MLHFVIIKLFSDQICQKIDREPRDVRLAEKVTNLNTYTSDLCTYIVVYGNERQPDCHWWTESGGHIFNGSKLT